jgi:hypothetical protein
MNNPATDFRAWMNSKELRAKDVCKRFGVSEQTIAHWRSKGVPERKQPHVDYIISCWEKPTAATLGSTLLIKPTPAQFNAWNEAWRHSNYPTLEQWAIDGLDDFAANQGNEHHLKVAESPFEYKTKPAEGNG